MKKSRIKIITKIAIFVIIAAIGLPCIWSYLNSYSPILKINWGFPLPSKAHFSEIYSKDSGASFHGDGVRYHILSYEDHEPIEKMFPWTDQEEKTNFSSSYEDAVSSWLKEINVSDKYKPNYSNCLYMYKSKDDNSEIILLWDSSKKLLYIAESFL